MFKDENYTKLIEAIQRIGKMYQITAESSALSAFRLPSNKEAQNIAKENVMKHDTAKMITDLCIIEVQKYWTKKD